MILRRFALSGLCLATVTSAAPPRADLWEIGPVIRGRNYSVGMPERPLPVREGLRFDFPSPSVEAGHVHALTYAHGPLRGKRRIVVRYRIDIAPGARDVRFVPQEQPDQPATVTLFFQRARDNWTARGRFADYRWYAPGVKLGPVARGTHDIVIRLDDPDWTQVTGQRAGDNAQAFAAAIAETDRIGLVFGSPSRRGHGVFATGRARFTLLDFRVE
jgi:hypothetical protein